MATKRKLNTLAATAISGNDISSSCLYVSSLAIVYAGQYAWIALLLVGGVLYLFRRVYGEVVGALPLNGGAYNALLNTTSKSTASLAATLTLLSYMATAVISANEAMHYAHGLFNHIPIVIATIGLLAFFMLLSIIGIKESSKVAIGIFLFHMFSLLLLAVFCLFTLFSNGWETLVANHNAPAHQGSVLKALFFGFSAAMLGISGFESSANFVEEQESGVFSKTLRNMWGIVTIANPLMAFLALSLLPIDSIIEHKEALLSHLGEVSAQGSWLSYLVSIDAVLVLSGAVLTSFVGVSGLAERMALDRVLPGLLLKKNKRGSSYRIAFAFFLLCVSILLITKGELGALAGVYTISFLSVMVLFGIGNVLLKIKRKYLPRPERSSWLSLTIAILAVSMAIVGNALLNPPYLVVFIEYFLPTILLVMVMLNRVLLLKLLLRIVKYLIRPLEFILLKTNRFIVRQIAQINSQEFVYFTKDDDIATLNKVMLYVTQNEHTRKLKIVTAQPKHKEVSKQFLNDLDVLDREYPEINIEFILLHETFGPDLIHRLSKQWNIPVNFMFIASPGDHFPYRIADLGGVRLII